MRRRRDGVHISQASPTRNQMIQGKSKTKDRKKSSHGNSSIRSACISTQINLELHRKLRIKSFSRGARIQAPKRLESLTRGEQYCPVVLFPVLSKSCLNISTRAKLCTITCANKGGTMQSPPRGNCSVYLHSENEM